MRASEFITEANYGRYWCSTDKQWKYRKGPKKSRRVKESIGESAPGGQLVQAILAVMPSAKEIWFHGRRATGKHRKDSDTDILVVVPNDVVGEAYLDAVHTLQNLASSYHNYDIQPTKSDTNIHRIAREEGQLLWQQTNENFANGKNPGRKGLSKRVGVDCKQSVSKLRKIAKNSSGEQQRMAHWCANMKAGKNK